MLEAAPPTHRTTWRDCLVAAVVLALLLPPLLGRMRAPGASMDEGSLLLYPELILHGKLPYRDFETVYGPGNIYLLSGAYALWGSNVFVERGVGLLYRLAILIATFGIARRWGIILAALATTTFGLLLTCSDLTAYAWMPCVAFALLGIWAIARMRGSVRIFIGGVCGGIALLCRIDFAPALFLSALPFFLGMSWRQKFIYVAAVLIAVSPLLYFAAVIGFSRLADILFFYPVFRLNPTRRLPIGAGDLALLRLLWVVVAAALIGVTAGVVKMVKSGNREQGRFLLGVSLFGAAGIPYAIQRLDVGHLLFCAGVPVTFALVALASAFPKSWSHARPWLAFAIVASTLSAALPSLPGYLWRVVRDGYQPSRMVRANDEQFRPGDPGFEVQRNGRSFFYTNKYDSITTGQVLAELQRVATSGQRLFVGPGDLRRTNYNNTEIYHLMPQLEPASYFLEMNPRSANAPGSRLAADIATADWLLLNRAYDYWGEANASQEYGPDEPNAAVHANFFVWAECGSYLLYANEKLRDKIKQPDGVSAP